MTPAWRTCGGWKGDDDTCKWIRLNDNNAISGISATQRVSGVKSNLMMEAEVSFSASGASDFTQHTAHLFYTVFKTNFDISIITLLLYVLKLSFFKRLRLLRKLLDAAQLSLMATNKASSDTSL